MKAMIKYTTLASLILASSAHAKTAWVEGALWKAPQATSLTLKLLGKENLQKDCALMRKAIFNADGTLSYIARSKSSLSRFRKLAEPIYLEVDHKASAPFVVNVTAENTAEVETDKLPYFIQTEAVTGFHLNDVEAISFVSEKGSYTQISKEMEFEDLNIEWIQTNSGAYVIKLANRDVACDLYEGNGVISMNTPAHVELDEKTTEKMFDFYNKRLLPELNGIVSSKTEILSLKAARIGYRTGKVLEDEFSVQSTEQSESQIRELMNSLLNTKTLELSSNVFRSDGRLHIKLESGLEAKNTTVKLDF